MYVSPAVRTIRDDPVEGESGTVAVTVAHERVADVCSLDGVATVETSQALGVDPDGAGEDVRFDEG